MSSYNPGCATLVVVQTYINPAFRHFSVFSFSSPKKVSQEPKKPKKLVQTTIVASTPPSPFFSSNPHTANDPAPPPPVQLLQYSTYKFHPLLLRSPVDPTIQHSDKQQPNLPTHTHPIHNASCHHQPRSCRHPAAASPRLPKPIAPPRYRRSMYLLRSTTTRLRLQ